LPRCVHTYRGKIHMSVQAMAWVIENSQTRGNQYIVLLMIANRADEEGASAWPSIRWLARRSRLSERTVQRAIRKLERGGDLGIEKAAGPKGTNRYQVIMQPGLYRGDTAVRGDKLTPRQGVQKGVTELCHPIHPNTSKTLRPPYPPQTGGEETFLDYHGTVIAIKMGRRKRLPRTNGGIMHPPYFVEFLESHGFPARIIEKEVNPS
jgi:hypothetical protein